MTKAPQLRLLLSQPNILVLPGAYDCISAKLAERVGFAAIFTSGFGAGADIIFIEAPQSVDDLRAMPQAGETHVQALPNLPLLANMIEGGKTPILSGQELQAIGFKIAVYPLSGLFAAKQAILTCFEHLKKEGTTNNNLSFTDFKQIIEVEKYQQLEKQFSLNHD